MTLLSFPSSSKPERLSQQQPHYKRTPPALLYPQQLHRPQRVHREYVVYSAHHRRQPSYWCPSIDRIVVPTTDSRSKSLIFLFLPSHPHQHYVTSHLVLAHLELADNVSWIPAVPLPFQNRPAAHQPCIATAVLSASTRHQRIGSIAHTQRFSLLVIIPFNGSVY